MSSKDTPKKAYCSKTTFDLSSCRLCRNAVDANYCKNIFKPANRNYLKALENLCGSTIVRHEHFPSLMCRPCERRVKNFQSFKAVVTETQKSFQEALRTKRCKDVSPSTLRPPTKTLSTRYGATASRGLQFDSLPSSHATIPQTSTEGEGTNISHPNVSRWQSHDHEKEAAFDQMLFNNEPENQKQTDLLKTILNVVNDELNDVARRTEPSVLRNRGYDGMSADGWMAEVIRELSSRCPTVYQILSSLIHLDYNYNKKVAPTCLIYGIIMFKRCHELSRIQRINTILLTEGNTSRTMFERLNKYGFCLEPNMKYTLLDEIGKHFLDQAIELVKMGHKFLYVIDNIDWEVKVHDTRQDNQNKSMHAMSTSIVFDRVSSDHLPNCGPQKKLDTIQFSDVIKITDQEKDDIRASFRVILAKFLIEYLTAFHPFKEVMPEHPPSLYSNEMMERSCVVTMPVLMKDEKKYSECVDVVDQLETWTHEIFTAAGLCDASYQPNKLPHANLRPDAHSRPDQPGSHLPPIPNKDDPLSGVSIPCFGDQLTRVRFAGVKDLRAGCHTPRERLDHIYPFHIVDWHTKQSYLKLVFKRLYSNSGREQGTLRYFREKLMRRNVTQDVKHYEDCEQFFLSVGKCFVIEALMEFFGMPGEDGSTTKNNPSSANLISASQRDEYLTSTLNTFLDQYVFISQRNQDDAGEDVPDQILNYSINIIRYFLILASYKDAVKSGNGNFIATLHKELILHFHSNSSFNAYAIEMLVSIVQNEVLLSPAQAHHCKWASTANWKGGKGNNIEIDLLQENRNKDLKDLIKAMGANKTDEAIKRASKAAGGVKMIVETFDSEVSLHKSSSARSSKSSAQDERILLNDLRQLRPFRKTGGRSHPSFPLILADPLQGIDQLKLNEWLERHRKNIVIHFSDQYVAEESDGDQD